MFKLEIILSCALLISSITTQILPNQLTWGYQGLNQPSYTDTRNNYAFIQQQPEAPKPTLPQFNIALSDSVKPPGWDEILSNPLMNSLLNPNTPIFPTDGYNNVRNAYDPNPNIPNIINNYFILPEQHCDSINKCPRENNYESQNIRYNNGKRRSKKENSLTKRHNTLLRGKSESDIGYTVNNDLQGDYLNIPVHRNVAKGKKHKKKKNKKNRTKECEENTQDNKQERIHLVQQETNAQYIDKEVRNLCEKEKQIKFDECGSLGTNQEGRQTRTPIPGQAIEYLPKCINSQDEFNKYLQSIFYGNLNNIPTRVDEMFSYDFDSLYKTPQKSGKAKISNNRTKPRKANKGSNKKNNENNKCNTVIELTPVVHKSNSESTTNKKGSNSKDVYINLKVKNNHLSDELTTIPTAETTQLHEHESLNIFDDKDVTNEKSLWINLYEVAENDDYEFYPDFTHDNGAYITSSEETEWSEFHKIDMAPFQNNPNKEDEENKVHTRSRMTKNIFKTPPALEIPDFKTTNVNTDKDAMNAGYKNIDKSKSNILIDKNVETMYVPSKVVNYNEPEIIRSLDIQKDEKNLSTKDGNTTIIYSKTINV